MDEPLHRLILAVHELAEASGFRFAIIGGVARGVWASPRATLDVDVLMDSVSVAPALNHASAAGLVAIQEEVDALARSGMTRLRLPDFASGAIRLDVIAADHPYYVRVIDRGRSVMLAGVAVNVAAPEDILLLKILADRTQDRADVEAIIEAQLPELDLELLHREAERLELELPATLRANEG